MFICSKLKTKCSAEAINTAVLHAEGLCWLMFDLWMLECYKYPSDIAVRWIGEKQRVPEEDVVDLFADVGSEAQ